MTSARRLTYEPLPELDRENLVRRAREDLELMVWDSPEERDEQYAILETEEARLGVTHVSLEDPLPEETLLEEPPSRPQRIKSAGLTLLEYVPPAEWAARWALRRPVLEPPPPPPPAPTFASPVEAAAEADRLHAWDASAITL